MVLSHIVYCINIYSCANTTSLNKLRVKQKEEIRIISNAGFRDHTAPLFAQLSILPLDQLIKLHILKFMHSFSIKHYQYLSITVGSQIESASLREFCGMLICCLYLNTILRQSRECLCSILNVFGMKRELKKNLNHYIYLRSVKRLLFQSLL